MTFLKVLTSVTIPLWGLMLPLGLAVWLVTLPLSMVRKVMQLIKNEKKAVMKVEVSGKEEEDAVDTVLFVHGWPDSGRLWDQQASIFAEKGYRCLVVTAPGFDGAEVGWGYTHEAVAEMLAGVVNEHTKSKKVTLFCHDWGCYWGYLLQKTHPDMVKRMITLDVGGISKPDGAGILFILSYQMYNMIAFLLGGTAGKFLNTSFLSLGRYKARPMDQLTSNLNYPYLYMVIKMFTGRAKTKFTPFKDIPVLYGYAKKRVVGFHAKEWITSLEQSKSCGTKEFDCDHWITVHKSEELSQWALDWLSKTSGSKL